MDRECCEPTKSGLQVRSAPFPSSEAFKSVHGVCKPQDLGFQVLDFFFHDFGLASSDNKLFKRAELTCAEACTISISESTHSQEDGYRRSLPRGHLQPGHR